jgi:hypothetical protein
MRHDGRRDAVRWTSKRGGIFGAPDWHRSVCGRRKTPQYESTPRGPSRSMHPRMGEHGDTTTKISSVGLVSKFRACSPGLPPLDSSSMCGAVRLFSSAGRAPRLTQVDGRPDIGVRNRAKTAVFIKRLSWDASGHRGAAATMRNHFPVYLLNQFLGCIEFGGAFDGSRTATAEGDWNYARGGRW